MIIVKAWKTYEGALVFRNTTLMKYQNDADLGFNIYEPKNWLKFLSNYKIKGKLLARKDKNGYPIVYSVYFWGVPKGHPKNLCSLFPGFDSEGKKIKLVDGGCLL